MIFEKNNDIWAGRGTEKCQAQWKSIKKIIVDIAISSL